MIEIDDDNFFDIAEAIHCYLTLYHDGQWSKKYELLCRSDFRPGPLWSESKVEVNNPYFDLIKNLSDDEIETLLNRIKNRG